MLEYPEVVTIAKQLAQIITGKSVESVLPPTKPHKFCWFNGNAKDYDQKIKGSTVMDVKGFGIYVDIYFDNGQALCFGDGVNVRLINDTSLIKDYQLLLKFNDGSALVFTVAMYGGIILHDENYQNEYYEKSTQAVSPLDESFKSRFYEVFKSSKPNLSVKAFLATEQRFPGIGNGVLQDILFSAKINPKRKIASLTDLETEDLAYCIKAVLTDMAKKGGRDTEKDIFGNCGKYKTIMSKNTLDCGCPDCGNQIIKEAYMGGAVYYCPTCQPLEKNED